MGRSSTGWPAQTQAGNDCQRCLSAGGGKFCWQHRVGAEDVSMLRPLSSLSSSSWPAQTRAGSDCQRCLNEGRGKFCWQHDLVGTHTIDVPTVRPHSSKAGHASSPSSSWPAQTQKGNDCSLCIDEGPGIFCRYHKVTRARRDEAPLESSSAVVVLASVTSRGWPAQTKAGNDCLRCIDEGYGKFCWHHRASGARRNESAVVESGVSVLQRTPLSSRHRGSLIDTAAVVQPRSSMARRQTRSTRQSLPRRQPVFPPSDLFDLLRENDLSSRREAVVEYRDGKDFYTQQRVNLALGGSSYHVDHVCEVQVVAHAMQAALKSRSMNEALVLPMKEALHPESLINFNVTSGSINTSKGQLFKRFLKFEGIDDGQGIEAISLTYQCERFMTRIGKALQESTPAVEELIRDSRRRDRHVTNNDFGKVADELGDLYDRMKI